jgi:hypothetical protein
MKHFRTMWSFSKHYTYRKKLQSKNTLAYSGLTSEQNKLECFSLQILPDSLMFGERPQTVKLLNALREKPENNCSEQTHQLISQNFQHYKSFK